MVRIGVYKLVNVSTGRFYIGSSKDLAKREKGHRSALLRGTHHNAKVKRLCAKYGPNDFTFEVVKYTRSVERARKLEDRLLGKYMDDRLCLNIGCSAIGGDNVTRNPRREAIISSMTDSLNARFKRLSAKERQSIYGLPGELNGMYGKTHTKASRKKMSEAQKGHSRNLGVPKSEEGRASIARAAKKRVAAIGYKNPFKGKKHSDETKAVLREIANERVAAGILPSNTRRVKIGKVVYRSVTEASRELGTCAATIINRIRNPRFPKYSYLD